MRSLPAPAYTSSSPPRPSRRSSLSVPRSVSSPEVPLSTSARAWCPANSAPRVTTITVSKMYSRFIRLPPDLLGARGARLHHCVCIRPVEVVLKRGKLKPLSSLAPDLTIHHRAPQRRLC